MENQQIIDSHVMLGEEHPLALHPDDLLRRMDSYGIDRAIARPMGAELVVGNQAGNNRVLKCGPRICGLVSVNPWYGPRAIDELKRCQQAGAVGLFLHPSRQGFMPTEPIVAPVLAFAADAQWPVMFHTGSYIYSDVLAVAEVARSFPQTQFILGCGGFADMWFEIPGAMADIPNLWLETSHTLGDGIRATLKVAGPQRIIFGSGEPSNCYASALKCLENLDFDADTKAAILRENARRLFRLT
jgi:predicted TIM-barrel fold metal-dependent hydrolase